MRRRRLIIARPSRGKRFGNGITVERDVMAIFNYFLARPTGTFVALSVMIGSIVSESYLTHVIMTTLGQLLGADNKLYSWTLENIFRVQGALILFTSACSIDVNYVTNGLGAVIIAMVLRPLSSPTYAIIGLSLMVLRKARNSLLKLVSLAIIVGVFLLPFMEKDRDDATPRLHNRPRVMPISS